MDRKESGSFADNLPSPEELFHSEEWEFSRHPEKKKQEAAIQWTPKEKVNQKEVENVQKQVLVEEPASKRKKPKLFSTGVVIGLLVLALIITNLRCFHIHLYCMMSESMGDVIPKGSLIISCEVPAEKLEPGDVITYMNRDGVLITHEITSVIENYKESGCYMFRTKGRANESKDEEEVTYGMVKGKALFYIPHVGKLFVK